VKPAAPMGAQTAAVQQYRVIGTDTHIRPRTMMLTVCSGQWSLSRGVKWEIDEPVWSDRQRLVKYFRNSEVPFLLLLLRPRTHFHSMGSAAGGGHVSLPRNRSATDTATWSQSLRSICHRPGQSKQPHCRTNAARGFLAENDVIKTQQSI
jgi:hypothetical protein